MQPKWVLEKDIFDEFFYFDLLEQLEAQNIEYKITHAFDDDDKWKKLFPPEDCVIGYGSFQFINRIKRETSWYPGYYHEIDNYRCSNYYPHLGEFLFNSPYIMLPVGEIPRMKDFIIKTLSPISEQIFVRPDRGDKIWAGQVIAANRLDEGIKYIKVYEVDDNEIAVCATAKTIAREWRIVVGDGEIIGYTQYQPINSSDCPDEVLEYARKIIDVGFAPDKVWTMDICQDMKNDLYLMEIGGFSCAGLYHANAKTIVENVSRIALQEWEDAYGGCD